MTDAVGKARRFRSKVQRVTAELSALADLERVDLIREWTALIGSPPPSNTSSGLLRTAIAFEIQRKALGRVPKRVERVLAAHLPSRRDAALSNPSSDESHNQRAASGSAASASTSALTPTLAPGNQLVREWNGRTWQVEVVKGGFVCRGKRYRSLSAIAKMITGAHWSGPRFFGLRS